MSKIRIMALGRCRDPSIAALASTYMKRIRSYVPAELLEIDGRGKNVLGRLSRSITPRDRVVALDAGGRMMDSVRFAAHLDQLLMKHERIVFVVGDADGFPPGFDDVASEKLSLSPMTFQHDLARVLFLEQLYRAFTILRHEPYHR
jgi:23S rRNA (pseudouridine1915-N3)-methyltransferase